MGAASAAPVPVPPVGAAKATAPAAVIARGEAPAGKSGAPCKADLEHRGEDGWIVRVTHGDREPCDAGTFVVRLLGPKGQQEAFAHPRAGVVEAVWVEDLDRDGVVEIAVATRTGGAGGKVDVAVFARGPQGWVARRIAPLAGEIAAGYHGRDRLEFVDGALIRRFPVFKPSDAACCPSGGVRTLGLAYAEGRWVPFHPRLPAVPQPPGAPQPAPPPASPPHG